MDQIVTCLDTELPGPYRHSWERTGLDIVAGTLCFTRRCVWCKREEHKGYGVAPKTWRPT